MKIGRILIEDILEERGMYTSSILEGSLEVTFPTIWTDEKQRWGESEKKARREGQARAEEKKDDQRRESQKKED